MAMPPGMPPGLLKEVPSAKGNLNKKKAMERRLAKLKGATPKQDARIR